MDKTADIQSKACQKPFDLESKKANIPEHPL
jgi:hypothetical protein